MHIYLFIVHVLLLKTVFHYNLILFQLKLILEMNVKAEIQILDSISPTFLSSVYLPGKLQYGGWL
jgi:DNA topoisomerase VI subunit A